MQRIGTDGVILRPLFTLPQTAAAGTNERERPSSDDLLKDERLRRMLSN